MVSSKDKRINKLKKKRIWPSVLGLLFIILVFGLIVVLLLAASIFDVTQRKLGYAANDSVKIAELFKDYSDENAASRQELLKTYLDINTDIEQVSLITKDGEQLWASGNKYPNLDFSYRFDFQKYDEFSDIRIVVEEDSNDMLEFEDGEVTLTTNILDSVNIMPLLMDDDFFAVLDDNVIVGFKIWYVIPVNDIQVLALNHIQIYATDLFMMIVSLIVFAVILAFFVLYYIVSFISFLISMRRTSKILYTDMVTGGDNWLQFVKKATSKLKWNRRRRYKNNYAMVHLRMYKYRSFCTCFGVREGEGLIEQFYLNLKEKLSKKEAISHHENAEFGLLLTYTDEQELVARLESIQQGLNAILPSMKMHFGIGVYLIAQGEKDIDLLYNNALLACEISGEENESRIAFFNVEMNKQKLWERKVEDDMDRALINHEFMVYLQPKISTGEERLAGAEALVRWIHPTEGFIPPNKFIPIFERNGFILKLDDYMLEEIARQQAEWIANGRNIVPISVNLSRAHFTREDLAEHICGIVDRYNVPHNVIELELTESAFFDDKKALLDTVSKLRNAGFIVSMDDFGAGYSSLNSLKELQLDVLKIDADFFRGSGSEERGMLIVSEVIGLAKKLNMKIVAEGIETREQVDFLAEQECDLIQGYFFAKPMPIHEFVEQY